MMANKSDDGDVGAIGASLILIIPTLVIILVDGWKALVCSLVWEWFFVPAGLPSISWLLFFFGMLLLVAFKGVAKPDTKNSDLRDGLAMIGYNVLIPLFVLIIAVLFRAFN